jgi:WD40 repeat protein/tetratricopeptide (TPR) repeat protein
LTAGSQFLGADDTRLPLGGLVQVAALSPDGGRLLASGSREVVLWDFAAGQAAGPALNCDNGVRAAWMSPDGQRVLVLTANEVRLWGFAGDNLPAATLGHDDTIRDLSVSPDGRQFATVTRDYRPAVPTLGETAHATTVRLWDGAGKPLGPPRRFDGDTTVVFTPAGPRVVTEGAEVRVWDALTGAPAAPVLRHDRPAQLLGFSADGRRLFTTVPFSGSPSASEAVHAWDLEKGEPLYQPIREEGGGMALVRLEADGRLLLTTTLGGGRLEVDVWDAATGRPVGKPVRLPAEEVSDRATASVNSKGDRIILLSPEATNDADAVPAVQWQLWDLAAAMAITKPATVVFAPEFSPDGGQFVTCHQTVAELRDAASGQTAFTLPHRYPVRTAVYSRDGRLLVTESESVPERAHDKGIREVRVWDAATGEPVSPPVRDRTFMGPVSPDREYVVLQKPALPPRPLSGLLPSMIQAGQPFQVYHIATGLPVTPPITSAYGLVAFSGDSRSLLYADGTGVRVLNLFPAQHTPEEWGELARLLSGGKLDRSDTPVPLDGDEVRQLWERWHARPPGYFGGSPEATLAWQLRESFRQEDAGNWFAAAWFLERLIAAGAATPREHYRLGAARAAQGEWPAAREALTRAVRDSCRDWRAHYLLGQASAVEAKWNDAIAHYVKALESEQAFRPDILRGRGDAYGHLKQWKDAAADYEGLRQSATLTDEDWQSLALLRLQLGDVKGYQQAYQTWSRDSGVRVDPLLTKAMIAGTVSLAANADADRKMALQFADAAASRATDDGLRQAILGAALYRDGRYAQAVKKLDQAIELRGKGGTAYDWLFLALAHHRLNHAKEARAWLDDATSQIDARPSSDWRMTIQLSVLRREAEEAIKGKPGPDK